MMLFNEGLILGCFNDGHFFGGVSMTVISLGCFNECWAMTIVFQEHSLWCLLDDGDLFPGRVEAAFDYHADPNESSGAHVRCLTRSAGFTRFG